MKKGEIDNVLVLVVLITISLSVLSISLSMTKLGFTGLATTADVGYVNVSVKPTVDMTIWNKAINFTSTFPDDSRTSYSESDVETIGLDGAPCTTDYHCGFNISNDGSHFLNISILLTDELFATGGYDNTKYLLYNVTMQDLDYEGGYSGRGNCSTGYANGLRGPDTLQGQWGQWRAVPSQAGGNISGEFTATGEVAICYLNMTDTAPDGNPEHRPDVARVDINITVPSGESEGPVGGAITFTASSANV